MRRDTRETNDGEDRKLRDMKKEKQKMETGRQPIK